MAAGDYHERKYQIRKGQKQESVAYKRESPHKSSLKIRKNTRGDVARMKIGGQWEAVRALSSGRARTIGCINDVNFLF